MQYGTFNSRGYLQILWIGVRRYPSRGISVLFFPPSSMQCCRRQIWHILISPWLYSMLPKCPQHFFLPYEFIKSILLQTAFGFFIATENGWIACRMSPDSWMQMSAIEAAFKDFHYKGTANVFWSPLIMSPQANQDLLGFFLILYLLIKRPACICFNQTVKSEYCQL